MKLVAQKNALLLSIFACSVLSIVFSMNAMKEKGKGEEGEEGFGVEAIMNPSNGRYIGTYRNPARLAGAESTYLTAGALRRPELEWVGKQKRLKVGDRWVIEQDFDIEKTIDKLKKAHQDFDYAILEETDSRGQTHFILCLRIREFIPTNLDINDNTNFEIWGPRYKGISTRRGPLSTGTRTITGNWLCFDLYYGK